MMRPEFFRGKATTGTEEFLQALSRKTFLSLWSYANVFRDQFPNSKSRYGKEICDLLVVVGDDVIIFSDKHCTFPDTGNIFLDWNRWYKRAVKKSADQLLGAERWIRNQPDRVFLDPECTIRLPVNISEGTRFHRIVVANGSADPSRAFFNGGSGSLIITPRLVGRDHLIDLANSALPEPPTNVSDFDFLGMLEAGAPLPFSVGFPADSDTFIHVLDETSLEIILQHLDTAPDLITYLIKKEDFIRSGKLMVATGEEDLLAFYIGRTDESGEHHFGVPERFRGVQIDEGLWEEFINSPEYTAQQGADRISYFWDRMIEHFLENFRRGRQEYVTHPNFEDQEPVFRLLAAENRTNRRALSRAFLEVISNTTGDQRATRVHVSTDTTKPVYIFLVLPVPNGVDVDEYRRVRRELLSGYCLVARLRLPEYRHFIGIGIEPSDVESPSEDLAYFDGQSFTEELREEALELQRELGLLERARIIRYTEREYPIDQQSAATGIERLPATSRNEPCPCGSGLKYKKCCWLRHREKG